MIGIVQALASLTPGAVWSLSGTEYSGLNWLDVAIPKPSETVVNAEIARLTAEEPFNVCKATAKTLIAATDWAVLPDVNISNKADFETYRAAVRALIITPVANPTFPTVPQPVWI